MKQQEHSETATTLRTRSGFGRLLALLVLTSLGAVGLLGFAGSAGWWKANSANTPACSATTSTIANGQRHAPPEGGS